jgi:hypothetical protein
LLDAAPKARIDAVLQPWAGGTTSWNPTTTRVWGLKSLAIRSSQELLTKDLAEVTIKLIEYIK